METHCSRGNVLIVAYNHQLLLEYQNYLHSVLGEYLAFNTLPLDQANDPSQLTGYHCILFATEDDLKNFHVPVDEHIVKLACARTFNHMFLNKIIQLPPHERVYLVNDDKDSTLSIIDQLIECGITQYEFIPFYPGCEDTEPDIDFAVTAGEPQLVPKRIRNILDIGNRIVDISTILELCDIFRIPTHVVNKVTRGYVNQILRIVKTTDTYYTNYIQTQQLMRTILFSLPMGICLFGEDKRIQLMNTKFAQALGLPSANYQGQPFNDCLPAQYAANSFVQNGDWTIETKNGNLNLSILNLVFPDADPVFLAFFPEQTALFPIQDQQNEIEDTGYAAEPYLSLDLTASPVVKNMLMQARHLALYDFPILIFGESGTQRRTLARAIHSYSRRHRYPFFVLHSPGNDLTEASLYQILEDTNHGTLVLSQVDRFSLEIQDLLVNVLTNVHGNFFSSPETRRFDVRIIGISDVDLHEKMEKGLFLPELFYLLTASTLQTVPLNQRKEDIPLLLDYFLIQLFHNTDMTSEHILSKNLLDFLKNYHYPGNIHELYNLSCSFFTKFRAHRLVLSDLPAYIRAKYQTQALQLTDLQYSVLSYLAAHPKAGRGSIQNALAEQGVIITDSSLRGVLKKLAEHDYLIVNRTKGGCEITEAGLLAIQNQKLYYL